MTLLVQNEVFPEKDFYLSTKANIFNFVLRVQETDTGIKYVERIDL